MKECPREPEILEAVCSGRWPEGCDSELRLHSAACQACAETAVVAQALQQDRSRALQNVNVPSAGLVWWRAELRARHDAARKAERPMSLMQAFAGACAVGVVIALGAGILPFVHDLFAFMHLPWALAAGAVLILAPLALYFVFSDK